VTDPPDRSVQRCPTGVPKRLDLICQADGDGILRFATLNYFEPERVALNVIGSPL
jgi:hypothetical protein